MPTHVKLILSLIVACTTIAAYVFQDHLGQAGPKYAVAFLGVFMIVGMWIFPEVMRKEIRGKIKQEPPMGL